MKMFVEPPDIYLHRPFVDFRKSINGLTAIVECEMQLSVMTGALFIFCNRSKNKLKILYWDKTGFALWYKRLEKHRFKWPRLAAVDCLKLDERELTWLLNGYAILGHQSVSYSSACI